MSGNPYHTRRIFAIHCGGLDGVAYGVPISQTRINGIKTTMNVTEKYFSDIQEPVTQWKEIDYTPVGHEYVGHVESGAFMNSKTGISPSCIFNTVPYPNTKIPARLKPFRSKREDGTFEVISPLRKAMLKWAAKECDPPYDVIDEAAKFTLSQLPKFDTYYIASFEEGVFGSEVIYRKHGLNQHTSAGYPHVLNGIKRKDLFNKEERTITSFFKNSVGNIVVKAGRDRVIVAPVYIGCLKDEKLPISKVLQGKARFFMNGPVDYLQIMNMVLGCFIHAVEAHDQSEFITVGTDPLSVSWKIIIDTLKTLSGVFGATDMVGFDTSLIRYITMTVFELIEKCIFRASYFSFPDDFLDWSEECGIGPEELLKILIRLLAEYQCSPYVLVFAELFILIFGGPSGGGLTSILNCMCNDIMHRTNVISLVNEVSDDKLAAWVNSNYRDSFVTSSKIANYAMSQFIGFYYGDDVVWTVGPLMSKYVNQVTMAKQFLKNFGVRCTNPDKTEIDREFIELDELTFLKRSFVPQDGLIVARLDMETILEMPLWVNDSSRNTELTESNVCDAMAELALYGREVWEKYYDIFETACDQAGIRFVCRPYEWSYGFFSMTIQRKL
jgi:hypothetical protein